MEKKNSYTNCVINVYPLSREMSSQQKEVKDGLVMFTVRDKCLLGTDKFLAEGFLSFADITNNTNSTAKLENMENEKIFDTWFKVDVRPFKQALLNTVCKWGNLFKQHLVDHVTNR